MNPIAQNAFLKALEEPPPSTVIILLAGSADVLLETVRSRCREVTFHPPTPADVVSLLEDAGASREQAEYFARIGGDLDRALALAADEDAQRVRTELVERVLAPMRDPGDAIDAAEWLFAQTRGLRDRLAEEHKEAKETYDQWYRESKRVSDERLRREQRRAEQDALDAAIDDISSVLRDLVASGGADLINDKQSGEIARRAEALGPAAVPRILACLGEIEKARRRLRANANVLLTLEDVFLSVHRHLS